MEDEKIIDLFWDRRETAIEETINKYNSYCLYIANNIINNIEDAKECVNDTYHAVWNKIPPTRPSNFKTFLGRITRNISLDRYDYNKAKKRNSQFDLLLSELEECIPALEDVEKKFFEGQLAKSISNFLRQCSEEQRIIFIRRYWYSDSIRDIAKEYKLNENNVKSILFRTRNKLKIYLEKEGMENG